jgi:malonyl-CoA/methylmalonyl-CoA synthetase
LSNNFRRANSQLTVNTANFTPPLEATHLQLLTDVLALRQRLLTSLSSHVRSALDRREEIYIAVLAPGGYEYTVAMLAALATNAAVVPLTVALPPHEALYFATKSRCAAVLCSSGSIYLGVALEKLLKDQDPRSEFTSIPIKPSTFTAPLLHPTDLKISSDRYLDDSAPGVVIFTSGTTGPPKAAVMRRGYVFEGALAVVDHYGITPEDVLLHVLPVHHATGLGIQFFPFLIAGSCTEYKSGGFSPAWTWERWRDGRGGARRLTFFSGVPMIYMRMKRYFEETLAHRTDVGEYIAGARNLRACLCGTSALPLPIADFWTKILGGRRILLRYGATEIGAVFKMSLSDATKPDLPDGTVGTLFAGCDVNLCTEPETEGEVLVKNPEMFSKYLYDPDATRKSHTAEGYYRTGDIARKDEKGFYFILGRASVDIIKSGGYKISALDIEREILGLPYVAEVMVVGVPDEEFGERVGAVVVPKGGAVVPSVAVKGRSRGARLRLEDLRQDLRERLAGYKMPTLLRVLEGGEELPKSGTGKVVKKVLGPQFFPKDYAGVSEVQVWKQRAGEERAKL